MCNKLIFLELKKNTIIRYNIMKFDIYAKNEKNFILKFFILIFIFKF
jgi:hypothetical protein